MYPALDPSTLALVVAAAFLAGFTTGFAGFGTGLVASGFWFHALPAGLVPPLVVLASVAAQLVGLVTIRASFAWRQTRPYLMGAVIGVPLGIAALAAATPLVLRTAIGVFLVAYTIYQIFRQRNFSIGNWGGRRADGVVGAFGGFLGGFAGLSGPIPLIWLQLRAGERDAHRAIYQPFNLLVLACAGVGMWVSGQTSTNVVWIALICLPATLIGAWIGARSYLQVSARTYQHVVLVLLFISGSVLIAQAF